MLQKTCILWENFLIVFIWILNRCVFQNFCCLFLIFDIDFSFFFQECVFKIWYIYLIFCLFFRGKVVKLYVKIVNLRWWWNIKYSSIFLQITIIFIWFYLNIFLIILLISFIFLNDLVCIWINSKSLHSWSRHIVIFLLSKNKKWSSLIWKNRIESCSMVVEHCCCNVAHRRLYVRIYLILLLVKPKSRINVNFWWSPRKIATTYWRRHRCVHQSFLAVFSVFALMDIL